MVGSKPAGDGRWGQSDLGGNVSEWALDGNAAYVNPCTDCSNLGVAGNRVRRGGSFFEAATKARAAFRYSDVQTYRDDGVGVRCARTP